MNPPRPTLAQHQRMQRLNAAFYADIQRSARSEHAAYRAEPVKHLQAVPQPEPMRATWRDNLIFAACSIAGLGVWAAAGYAAWWAAGVYAALHGAK